MSQPARKPIPVPDQDTEAFWAATGDGRLVVQRCRSCEHRQLYPRLYCRRCHRDDLELIDSAGTGAVYSHTVILRAGSPAFAEDVPYVVALVRLDDGPTMMANISGRHWSDVAIGSRVEVDFGDRRGEVAVPRFHIVPADTTPSG
jgi:hypothetical protein